MQQFVQIFLIALLSCSQSMAQVGNSADNVRQGKLEDILRAQDLRTPQDGRLVSYLNDDDPVIRERATVAYGSLQDTTVLSLLQKNLVEGPASLQEVAAFAIGQTGTQLSPSGRDQLEHELIWKHLDATAAKERLIEEIGKFGTGEGLKDLMIKVGNVPPFHFRRGMTMCIARYAIRGTVSDEAVRYLLQFIQPAEETTWETVYALQRIGNHPIILSDLEHLVLLERSKDPLVRMNLALLLGKLRDARTSLEPLCRLAESDLDWRVRVNALRALANFPIRGNPSIITLFKKSFYDQNDQIAMTALGVIGSTGLDASDTSDVVTDMMYQLRFIVENRAQNLPWQHQGTAAFSYAQLAGASALPSVSPTTWPDPRLQALLLEAVGATGAPAAQSILLPFVTSDQSPVACAALEALRTLATHRLSDTALMHRCVEAAVHALSSGDVAVVTTAASVLGDSIVHATSSVNPLLQTLNSLRLPDDVEAIQEIISTLGKLGDRHAVEFLMKELHAIDRSVALAAVDALRSITGQDYSSGLRPWYQPVYTDFDFNYLRSLPSRIQVVLETSKGTITLELNRDHAPFTIASMLKLSTQRGFFRGLQFHRVVPNFVVQGGDPRGDGWGGPGYALRSEFSPAHYETGTVGIASAGKDTEGSQFFITHSPQPHLDGRYTVIGRVVRGMDIVDGLQIGDRIFDLKILAPDQKLDH